MKTSIQSILILLSVSSSIVCFSQEVKEPQPIPSEWEKNYEPFRIVGNLYYVGTYDLACYLVTTPQGHVLINTGVASSAKQIESNIKKLGFGINEIKVLLTTQAHYDHLGAMAAIKKITNAVMMANREDAAAIEDGGRSDYFFGDMVSTFEPIKVDRLLQPNDTIKCGGQTIVMLHHPGHTKGSCSFLLPINEDKKNYTVLIANMPTIVVEGNLDKVVAYPTIRNDYDYTFRSMKNIQFDIWLASHASQFKLHSKRKPGDAYNPQTFMDTKGYHRLLRTLQQEFEKVR
jgi:metallo-beta-lactamase class B